MQISQNFISRLNKIHGNNELIIKAIGKTSKDISILDTTAGLGRDSMIMSRAGYQVSCCEKNPKIYKMLLDNLELVKKEVSLSPIQTYNENAISFLETTTEKFDIIYLDPMFHIEGKSAKAKKDLQALQEIAPEEDFRELFNIALTKTTTKLILKRPKKAPMFQDVKPNYQIIGKAIRFDVYLAGATPAI